MLLLLGLVMMVLAILIWVVERKVRFKVLRQRDIEVAETRVDIEIEAVFGVNREIESRIRLDRVQRRAIMVRCDVHHRHSLARCSRLVADRCGPDSLLCALGALGR